MAGRIGIRIITCPMWDARKPKQGLTIVGKSSEIVLHHTASHLRQISNPAEESIEEAMRYARDIQNYHMDVKGWNDSGHNFLVTRGGHALQGRWLTVSSIQADHMVWSAHAGSDKGNHQIGIECEHKDLEEMTAAQVNSFAHLVAWCSFQYGLKKVLPIKPHKAYSATACPVNLIEDIPRLTKLAQQVLDEEGYGL